MFFIQYVDVTFTGLTHFLGWPLNIYLGLTDKWKLSRDK